MKKGNQNARKPGKSFLVRIRIEEGDIPLWLATFDRWTPAQKGGVIIYQLEQMYPTKTTK